MSRGFFQKKAEHQKNTGNREARFDIRVYKKELRSKHRAIQASIPPDIKEKKDAGVRSQVLKMREYQKCDLLLCFVSLPREINTHPLIVQAILDGKTVAVPYCIEHKRELEFYKITSLDELVVRTYSVLEPIAKPEDKITQFDNALCILPGLAFDRFGYRLGYGGGYYDRFLSSKFTGTTAGICYQKSVSSRLIHGHYDVPSDYIVTEFSIRKSQRSKQQKRT